MGLKAVAIYRDNCKVGQPLSMAKKGADGNNEVAKLDAPAEAVAPLNQSSRALSAANCRGPAPARHTNSVWLI